MTYWTRFWHETDLFAARGEGKTVADHPAGAGAAAAVAAREQAPIPVEVFDALRWVHPDRRLTRELDRVLQAGDVRGADAWHLACALYLAGAPGELTFLTADTRQGTVAEALGFST